MMQDDANNVDQRGLQNKALCGRRCVVTQWLECVSSEVKQENVDGDVMTKGEREDVEE